MIQNNQTEILWKLIHELQDTYEQQQQEIQNLQDALMQLTNYFDINYRPTHPNTYEIIEKIITRERKINK